MAFDGVRCEAIHNDFQFKHFNDIRILSRMNLRVFSKNGKKVSQSFNIA